MPAADPLRSARPLLVGLGLGVLSQVLFHGADMGANYTLFVVALVGMILHAEARPRGALGRPRVLFVATLAVASASARLLRASTWSAVFAVPTSASLVALLPLVIQDDVDSIARATVRAFVAPGALPAVAHEIASESAPLFGARGRRTLSRVVVGLLIGAPIAAGFAILLAFDRNFTGLIDRLFDRAWGITSVVVWGFVEGAVLLLAYRMLARRSAAPPSTRPLRPYRQIDDAAAPATTPSGLVSPLTWGIIVAQTATVFLLYAAVNARTWFAGRRAIDEGDQTYASYLHAGFVQLLLAATLSIGMVVLGHALLRPYGAPARAGAPVPGGKKLAAVEVALLGGTAIALLSCAQRLWVYVEAYGATYERLAVGAVCIFVAFVVVLTAVKSAKRDFRSWASALLSGAAVFATACALFDADGTIAEVNVERAARGEYLDVPYLEGLSCDARPALGSQALDADARATLDAAWTPSRGDVRARRGVLACGR
ncbi:hypothetical protein BH09MYX1_BH09MYX1_24310 [soil metagenome]